MSSAKMMPSWNSIPPPPGTQTPTQGFSSYQSGPAYTAVQARQTFGSPPYPSSSTNAPTMSSTTPSQVQHPAHPGYDYHYSSVTSTANHHHPSASPHTPATASEEPTKKIEWPNSVRNYVQRSFMPENLDSHVTRTEMEAKLKETISSANESGVMYSIDWDSMPLPQQMIRDERARSLVVTPKKRKSSDLSSVESPAVAPPWRKNVPLGDRIAFTPAGDKTKDEDASKISKSKLMEKRFRRFDGGYTSTYRADSPSEELPTAGPVVGTCQSLEKQYFRLTAPPISSNVRPDLVLRKTLELLKKKWKQEGNYAYICDQFKSLRQDLTVQRIKTDFTVSVYEIHARIALEKGDLGEYNQCQTQLRALYQQGLNGSSLEFKAYRILYFIHTANRAALNDAIKDLTTADKQDEAVKHALDVRSSLALGNYHRFFQLYMSTPHMGAYLMDMFVDRERLAALSNMCKAYKPEVPLRFVTEELAFESDLQAADFILTHGSQELLAERQDMPLIFLTGKAGTLFESAKTTAFSRVDIKGQI